MRIASLTAAIVLIAAPGGLAEAQEAHPLEPAFANTLLSTYPDGRTARLWLNRDGTYTSRSRRNRLSSGRWSLEGERVCMRQQRPFPGPFRYCTPLQRGGVGTRWSARAPTGEAIQVELVAGR